MVNYQNGKIYKICDANEEMVYIGSTTKKYLSQRMDEHRSKYKAWKNGKTNNVTVYNIFEKYGVDNCNILLIENCTCNSRDELNAREGYYIRLHKCINKCVAGRTSQEYGKQYHEKNKEKKSTYAREYRKKNRQSIRKRQLTKHACCCGSEYTQTNKIRHMKSKKHIDFMSRTPLNRLKRAINNLRNVNEMAKIINS